MSRYDEALQVMVERFGQDTLLSLATSDNNCPSVRTVNSFYEDGAFYVVTYALSNKMKHIGSNPKVAVCGDWFTAHGIGENLGYVRDPSNTVIMAKLREAFAAWYDNGHTNEDDTNTILLRIRLTNSVVWNHGTKYEIDFVNQTA